VTVIASVPTKAGAVNDALAALPPTEMFDELRVEVIIRFFFATTRVRWT
jgi:hypothetical protein